MDLSKDILSRWSFSTNFAERCILNAMIQDIKKANTIESFNDIKFSTYFRYFSNFDNFKNADQFRNYLSDDDTVPSIKKSFENYNLYEPLINGFKDLNDVGIIQNENSVSAAIVLYSIIILLSYNKHGIIINTEQIISYIMIYILADELIDGTSLNKKDKHAFLSKITEFIKSPDSFQTTDINVLHIINRIKNITNNIPGSFDHIVKHINTETEVHKLQRVHGLSQSEYLDICERKGGDCCNVIFSIIYLPVDSNAYEFGCLIQLCDDLIDIDEDIESAIDTIATYNLNMDKNLDNFVHTIIQRIDNLDINYNIAKPWFISMVLCSVSTNPNYYTKEFLNMAHPYISSTKDEIIPLLHQKFVTYYSQSL